MKHVLLTAALIAAAVASGDLLARATVPQASAARAAARLADAPIVGARARTEGGKHTRSDDRPRVSVAWLDSISGDTSNSK